MARIGLSASVVVACLMVSSAARAQSAIAGQVTDTTGAVLPGVSVEASSPSLIGGSRAVVTDGQGRYAIEQLVPGVYRVAFSLSGFTTVVREGIQLVTNFTAPVNVQLSVGTLQESVTVSGASPIVDVDRTVSQTVMSRDVLDTIPEGRGYAQAGVLIPGFVASAPDVGGTTMMHQKYLTIHGSTAAQTIMYVDGMNADCALGTGSTPCNYVDVGAMQEIAYTSGGGTAELQVGAVVTNLVPKSGGNRVSGQGANFYSDHNFGASNYGADLRAQGLTAPPSLVRDWDYDWNAGGPIRQNKLWFFGAYRNWGVNTKYSSSFVTATGEQTVDENLLQSMLVKLNLQASATDNVTVMYNRMPRWRGSYGIAPGINFEASGDNSTPNPSLFQAKWTSVRSSKLLTEVGLSDVPYVYDVKNNPGISVTVPPKRDLVTSVLYNNQPVHAENFTLAVNVMAAMSYVTGTHSFKVGVQHKAGHVTTLSTGNGTQFAGDLTQLYQAGRPFGVAVYNTPTVRRSDLNHDLGIYAQDSWKLGRLTINPGVRYDYLAENNPAQTSPSGTWVGARNIPAASNVPKWQDVSPRFGVAYDLFGNGKTVAKFSAGKYVFQDVISYASKYNPNNVVSEQRTWADANGDGLAQPGEIGPPQSTTFGLPSGTTTLDPNNKRPFDVLMEASVTRELLPNVGLQAYWAHRKTYDVIWTQNLSISPSDYALVQIPDPRGNGEMLPLYNLNPSKRSVAISNFDTTSATNSPTIFNGYGASITARFGRGGNLLAGFDSGRTYQNNCQFSDPNAVTAVAGTTGTFNVSSRFCDTSQYGVPFRTQYKLSGSYPLPWGASVGAFFQSVPGTERTLTYLVTRAVYPQLVQPSATIPLNTPGSVYYPRLNQIDLKLSKTFRYRATRITPQLDLFNVTNAATLLTQVNSFGPSLGNVQSILNPRFLRFGATLNF